MSQIICALHFVQGTVCNFMRIVSGLCWRRSGIVCCFPPPSLYDFAFYTSGPGGRCLYKKAHPAPARVLPLESSHWRPFPATVLN